VSVTREGPTTPLKASDTLVPTGAGCPLRMSAPATRPSGAPPELFRSQYVPTATGTLVGVGGGGASVGSGVGVACDCGCAVATPRCVGTGVGVGLGDTSAVGVAVGSSVNTGALTAGEAGGSAEDCATGVLAGRAAVRALFAGCVISATPTAANASPSAPIAAHSIAFTPWPTKNPVNTRTPQF